MRICFTGGHLTPTVAIIDAIRKSHKDVQIFYFGHRHAMRNDSSLSQEFRAISDRKIEFINIGAIRSDELNFITFPRFIFGIIDSIRHLYKIKPCVVVGMGSFISVPVCIAAFILRINICLHDQTVIGGRANHLLKHISKLTMISWPRSKEFFKSSLVTGNPIRSEILDPSIATRVKWQETLISNKPLLFVTGGNLGSSFINNFIDRNLDLLLKSFEIVHQCGDTSLTSDYSQLLAHHAKLTKSQQNQYHLHKYLSADDMGVLLQKSSIILSRSGANTVTEIGYLGLRAVFIPLPGLGVGEQIQNAKILVRAGSAVSITQENASDEKIIYEVLQLLENKHAKVKAEEFAKTMTNPADLISGHIIQLCD